MSKRVTQFIVLLYLNGAAFCSGCKERAPLPDPGSSGGSSVTPNPTTSGAWPVPCFMFGNKFPTTAANIPPQFPGDVAEDHIHTVDVTDEGHGQTNRAGNPDPKVAHDHAHPIGAWQVSEVLGHTHTIIRLPKCDDASR